MRRVSLKNTPEKMRKYQEHVTDKNTNSLRLSTRGLSRKIDKIIPVKIRNNETDPYKIYIKFKKGGLSLDQCLKVILNRLRMLEQEWYIAIKFEKMNLEHRYDLNLTAVFQRPDHSAIIYVSRIFILGEFNYKTPIKTDVESSEANDNCIVCYSNKRACAYFPCGHTKFCWGCTDRLFSTFEIAICPICKTPIGEARQIYV